MKLRDPARARRFEDREAEVACIDRGSAEVLSGARCSALRWLSNAWNEDSNRQTRMGSYHRFLDEIGILRWSNRLFSRISALPCGRSTILLSFPLPATSLYTLIDIFSMLFRNSRHIPVYFILPTPVSFIFNSIIDVQFRASCLIEDQLWRGPHEEYDSTLFWKIDSFFLVCCARNVATFKYSRRNPVNSLECLLF